MIFKILKIRKSIREARENPGKFGAGELMDLVKGVLVVPALVVLGVLVILFIFGFTHIIGAPSGLARFFFVLFLIPTVIVSIFINRLLNSFKNRSAQFVNTTVKKVSNIVKEEQD
jgi:membrane protein implicated in regulation of membrane protease activity